MSVQPKSSTIFDLPSDIKRYVFTNFLSIKQNCQFAPASRKCRSLVNKIHPLQIRAMSNNKRFESDSAKRGANGKVVVSQHSDKNEKKKSLDPIIEEGEYFRSFQKSKQAFVQWFTDQKKDQQSLQLTQEDIEQLKTYCPESKDDPEKVKQWILFCQELYAQSRLNIDEVDEAASLIFIKGIYARKSIHTRFPKNMLYNLLNKFLQQGDLTPHELRHLKQRIYQLSIVWGKDIFDYVDRQTNNTPLMLALRKKNLEVIEILLQYGAHTDLPDYCGKTPLSFVLSDPHIKTNERIAIVKMLLEHGAKVDLPDGEKNTPFSLVISSYYMEADERIALVKMLLEHGVKIDNFHKEWGYLLLIKAIAYNRPKIVRLLLKHGVKVNLNKWGHTPLIEAIAYNRPKIVRLLLEHGANPNFPFSPEKKEGVTTPLLFLMIKTKKSRETLAICNILLNHPQIQLDLRNKNGETALDAAKQSGKHECAALIQQHLAKKSPISDQG